jgi:branched-chain amino acid transport system permease protein
MSLGSQVLQYVITGISVGAIYAIIALGFVVIFHGTRLVNFAQGDFVMVGGMSMVMFVNIGIPTLPAFCLSVIMGVLVGSLIYRLVVKPAGEVSGLRMFQLMIGAGVCIRSFAQVSWGAEFKLFPPFSNYKPIHIFGAVLLPQVLWILGITLLLFLTLYLFFERTILGKALRACSMNQLGSRLLGIKVSKMSLLSFVLAASSGAIAGIIITPITTMNYEAGMMFTFKGYAAAIVGGMRSFRGAVLGGFALGILENLAAGLVTSRYKDAIAFFALMLFLVYKSIGGETVYGVTTEQDE